MPRFLAARHDLGGAQNRRHVQIVPAGVHDRNVAPGVVFRVYFAGVGQSGFFFDGKSIQFSAQHNGRPGPVLEDRNHARPAHMFGHVIPRATQACSQFCRGLRFVRRKLRVLVKVKIERVRIRISVFQFF